MMSSKQFKFLAAGALALVMALGLYVSAMAMPALDYGWVFTDGEGNEIQYIEHGDEFVSWKTDLDNNLIVFEGDNVYYAYWDEVSGEILSTGVSAAGLAPQESSDWSMPESVSESAYEDRFEAQAPVYGPMEEESISRDSEVVGIVNYTTVHSSYPGIGSANVSRKVLIINVVYEDDALGVRPHIPTLASANNDLVKGLPFSSICEPLSTSYIENMVFGRNDRTMNDYYMELFGVDYDVLVPALDGGVFTVTVPYMYAQYYNRQLTSGNNGGTAGVAYNPHTWSNTYVKPRFFSQYPGIQDRFWGLVTSGNVLTQSMCSVVHIVHGYEGSSNQALGQTYNYPQIWGVAYGSGWSTSWNGRNMSVSNICYQSSHHIGDGLGTSPNSPVYTAGKELDLPLTIGIVVHELGHSGYSWADIYDYGSSPNDGTAQAFGSFSMQASGSWGAVTRAGDSPTFQDAYNLCVAGGQVTPITVAYNQLGEFSNMINPTDIVRVNSGGGTSYVNNQYFLLQNRRAYSFDEGMWGRMILPAHNVVELRPSYFPVYPDASGNRYGGLLIAHVDPGINLSRYNDKNTHLRAGVVEAHGGLWNMSIPDNVTTTTSSAYNGIYRGATYATDGNRGHNADFWGITLTGDALSDRWGEADDAKYAALNTDRSIFAPAPPGYVWPLSGSGGTLNGYNLPIQYSNVFTASSTGTTLDNKSANSGVTIANIVFDYDEGSSFEVIPANAPITAVNVSATPEVVSASVTLKNTTGALVSMGKGTSKPITFDATASGTANVDYTYVPVPANQPLTLTGSGSASVAVSGSSIDAVSNNPKVAYVEDGVIYATMTDGMAIITVTVTAEVSASLTDFEVDSMFTKVLTYDGDQPVLVEQDVTPAVNLTENAGGTVTVVKSFTLTVNVK